MDSHPLPLGFVSSATGMSLVSEPPLLGAKELSIGYRCSSSTEPTTSLRQSKLTWLALTARDTTTKGKCDVDPQQSFAAHRTNPASYFCLSRSSIILFLSFPSAGARVIAILDAKVRGMSQFSGAIPILGEMFKGMCALLAIIPLYDFLPDIWIALYSLSLVSLRSLRSLKIV